MTNVIDEDRVAGVIFGEAIGDALGLGAEFLSRLEVQREYPDGLKSYEVITERALRKVWRRGEWSDDTAQMLCIMDSLLTNHKVNINDVAARFKHWARTDG